MLSIDVGYGNTKIYDGQKFFAFPSVYYKAKEGERPSRNKKDLVIEVDGEKYHVGKAAIARSGDSPMNREDMFRHKLFVLSAICFATTGDFDDEVLLGLPIGDMDLMERKLKRLKGEYDVSFNGRKRHINIKAVKVFAQAESIYSLLYQDDLNIENSKVGIIDIGQKTIDLAYYSFDTYVDDKSGSLPDLGCKSAYLDIKNVINRKLHMENVEWYEVPIYLKRSEAELIKDDIDRAFKDMADSIIVKTDALRWDFRELDYVLVVGGGAFYIRDYIRDKIKSVSGKDKVISITADDIQEEKITAFANAWGYYEGAK